MNSRQMNSSPVVIIGAGPAGLAAAMQLQRQGIYTVVLERKQIGGLLLNANWVENYPGFVNGISGPDLVRLFADQAERLGVEVFNEEVLYARYEDGIFRIVTNKRELKSKILVAGTGTKPRKIAEDLFVGDLGGKVFSEVYPLLGKKGKEFVIIGAGDAAFDFALNLSKNKNNKIVILNRGSEIKALSLLFDRTMAEPAIQYITNTEVLKVSGRKSGTLEILTRGPGQDPVFECDYLLAAIGREPEYSFADPSIMEGMDTLLKDQQLFLIGDLQNGSFRQTSIAVADGIRTAMIIGQILEKG